MGSNGKKKLRILLIEDSPFDSELIRERLRGELDCEVVEVRSHLTLLNELDVALPDVIVSDSNVPRFNGFVALDYINVEHPEIPFIFCSGNNSPMLQTTARARGAKAWVPKDDLSRLVIAIKQACGRGD